MQGRRVDLLKLHMDSPIAAGEFRSGVVRPLAAGLQSAGAELRVQ